jgi:peptidoglycan-N-acetylglucosamine deacetylase
MPKIVLSVDVEQDCPPFLRSMRGIEAGLPRLLELFAETGIASTFFTTGQVAERYPDMLHAIVTAGHELACHGYSHRCFDTMDEHEARQELVISKQILGEFGTPIRSFRAPNLRFPEHYLPLLGELGFTVDASSACYKKPYLKQTCHAGKLVRIPATATSSIIRLPFLLAQPILSKYPDPVLFVHPWEFVDMSKTGIRFDCRFNTGEIALRKLKRVIDHFRAKAYRFVTISEYALLSI